MFPECIGICIIEKSCLYSPKILFIISLQVKLHGLVQGAHYSTEK